MLNMRIKSFREGDNIINIRSSVLSNVLKDGINLLLYVRNTIIEAY